MALERPDDVRRWLEGRPSLDELRDAYPAEWQQVQPEIAALSARGDLEELKARVLAVSAPAPSLSRSERRARGEHGAKGADAAIAAEIRRHMTAAALKRLCLSAATGVKEGRVRFNLVNGYVAQKLLFKGGGFDRKPVSLAWFRLIWPLLPQRELLMPLVGSKGIYCFYSRKLVEALAAEIGERSCLEIAAGDGTLSRFLADVGVDVTATDDQSWEHSVTFPESVLKADAREALRTHRPQVVVCSWPPAGNPFEAAVFATRSVELYLVVSSRHRFAAGDWAAYEAQDDFEFAEDPELSRLVLPPELEAAVYRFRRRKPATA